MKDNSQFAKEFMAAAKDTGKKAMMSDVVGMPDDDDKENIRRMILRYEKRNPGIIGGAIDLARKDFQAQGGNVAKFGEVNKDAHGRLLFEIPQGLYEDIEAAYPTMFRDTKHFRWFVKNFRELLIPAKY